MKSRSKSKSSGPKIDPYLEGLMSKLVDRLITIEKKVDSLLAQTAGKSNGNGEQPKSFQAPVSQPLQPRRDRTMYEAICADCSKVCEVPFRPSEDRAVYCKTCFAKRKEGGNRPGMPILRPVSLLPKPVGKLHMPVKTPSTPVKAKKSKPAKKAKKKK